MKKILVNYDSFLDKNILTQTIKIISTNYKDLEFYCLSKDKIAEINNFERIYWIENVEEEFIAVIDNSCFNIANTSLIRSPYNNFLLTTLDLDSFSLLNKSLKEEYTSTYEIKNSDELYKGKIEFENIFLNKTKFLLIDKENYDFFFKSIELLKNYFIAKNENANAKKGTFSKLNEYFFKNFSSSSSTNQNLYTDIVYPLALNLSENKIALSFLDNADINLLIKGFNILISLLNNSLDLINK